MAFNVVLSEIYELHEYIYVTQNGIKASLHISTWDILLTLNFEKKIEKYRKQILKW